MTIRFDAVGCCAAADGIASGETVSAVAATTARAVRRFIGILQKRSSVAPRRKGADMRCGILRILPSFANPRPRRTASRFMHGHVPRSAALMIVGATLCFSSLDSIVKHLSAAYPIPQLVCAWWMFQDGATAVWLGPRMKLDLVRTKRLKLQIARGVTLVLCGLLFL